MSAREYSVNFDLEPIDIVVYFPDKSGILLKVKDGQNMEAGELFELVLEEMDVARSLYPLIRDLFSIWLVSDLLELQLKPNHVPFKLACYWEELLEKYTLSSEEAQQRDEPIIIFQRNVFCNKSKDLMVNNQNLLSYLYYEAKNNVIKGKYPFVIEKCLYMAVLQTKITGLERINDQTFDTSKIGSYDFYKKNLRDYLPYKYCKRNLIWNREKNPDNLLSIRYMEIINEMDGMSLADLYKQYIEVCCQADFYGSAFFTGQAENPGRNEDDPIWIAINTDQVTIINKDYQLLLLSLPFEELSWQFAETKMDHPHYLPCLFLYFPFVDENNLPVTKLFQIFSKSALLADNLIESCVKKKLTEKIEDKSRILSKPARKSTIITDSKNLALMTFDTKGHLRKSTIRNIHPPEKSDNESESAV